MVVMTLKIEKGSLAIIIIIVMSVVMLFAMSISAYCIKENELSLNMYDHYEAVDMAESGMEYVKTKIDGEKEDINAQIENEKRQCESNGTTLPSGYANDLLNSEMNDYCFRLNFEEEHKFDDYNGSFKIYKVDYNDAPESPKTVVIDVAGTCNKTTVHYSGSIKFTIENDVIKSKIISWFKE